MASTVRPPDQRALRLSGLPNGADAPPGGGAAFVTYCLGGRARAEHRRDAIKRARARYLRHVRAGKDAYPAALVCAQRMGVAIEDLGRLVIGLRALRTADAFDALRGANYNDLDAVFQMRDEAELRALFRLPSRHDIDGVPSEELPDELREPLVAASDALAARWTRQWRSCAGAWPLLRGLAKGMRHGAPLIPRELIVSPPGAGALGAQVQDVFERWVLLIATEHDASTHSISTQWSVADLSEAILKLAHHGALEGIALADKLAGAHAERVRLGCKWVLERDAFKTLPAKQRGLLEEHLDG